MQSAGRMYYHAKSGRSNSNGLGVGMILNLSPLGPIPGGGCSKRKVEVL